MGHTKEEIKQIYEGMMDDIVAGTNLQNTVKPHTTEVACFQHRKK